MKLSDEEYLRKLEQQSVIDQDFIDAAFSCWLVDSDDYRSPFPEYMRDELSERAFRLFMEWIFELDNLDTGSAEELSERFGEIILEAGLALAQTPDEQITIRYPDLPRVGDKVNVCDSESKVREGEVVQRSLVEVEGRRELRVRVRFSDTLEEWESGFVLTE